MSPYFTHASSSGVVRAVYSGRFAFVPGVSSEVALALLAGEQADSSGNESFQEELGHALVSLTTDTGLLLGGLRMAVRALWLTTGWMLPVFRYYEFRTLFYAGMYEAFENDIVKASTLKIRSRNPIDVRAEMKTHAEASRLIRDAELDRKSTRLNSSHIQKSRMPSSA